MSYIKDFDKDWEEIENSPEYKKMVGTQDTESEGYKKNLEELKKEFLLGKQQDKAYKEKEIKFWQERLKMAFGDKETRMDIQRIINNLED